MVLGILIILLCLLCGCTETPQNTNDPTALPELIISHIDDAEMQLIPSGTFLMGNHKENIGDEDELPVHEVFIDAFYMDIHEVTNARYQQFIIATGYPPPPLWHDSKFNKPDAPVVNVTWQDAVVYASWANKRLPTEAEWEYAARGNLVGKMYPSGDIITRNDANFGGGEGRDIWRWSAPVGSFAPNGYGLYDMAGNVWEWCFDEYNAEMYATSPKQNPRYGRETAPGDENFRILRGGGWSGSKTDLRVSDRWYHLTTGSTIGFRCVKDVEE